MLNPRATLQKHGIRLLLLWLTPVIAAAQDSSRVEAPILFGSHALYYFPTASGASIMLERPIRQIGKQARSRRGMAVTKIRRDILSFATVYYHYPQYQNGLSVMLTAARQYLKNDRFYTSLSAGIGLIRTFYAGSVYQAEPDGSVKLLPGFGRTYGLGQLSYSMNWRLRAFLHSRPVLTLRPSWQLQFPYNSFIKPNFMLEAGILFSIGRVKIRSVTKMKSRL